MLQSPVFIPAQYVPVISPKDNNYRVAKAHGVDDLHTDQPIHAVQPNLF